MASSDEQLKKVLSPRNLILLSAPNLRARSLLHPANAKALIDSTLSSIEASDRPAGNAKSVFWLSVNKTPSVTWKCEEGLVMIKSRSP